MNKQLRTHTLLLPLLAGAIIRHSQRQANAADGEAIVKKARCVACHTVDQKRVGPGLQGCCRPNIKGDSGAPGKLFEKVRAGGSGNWGEIPMLAHPADKISDDDLHAAIKWILALE
jgi:cytochrome c